MRWGEVVVAVVVAVVAVVVAVVAVVAVVVAAVVNYGAAFLLFLIAELPDFCC